MRSDCTMWICIAWQVFGLHLSACQGSGCGLWHMCLVLRMHCRSTCSRATGVLVAQVSLTTTATLTTITTLYFNMGEFIPDWTRLQCTGWHMEYIACIAGVLVMCGHGSRQQVWEAYLMFRAHCHTFTCKWVPVA